LEAKICKRAASAEETESAENVVPGRYAIAVESIGTTMTGVLHLEGALAGSASSSSSSRSGPVTGMASSEVKVDTQAQEHVPPSSLSMASKLLMEVDRDGIETEKPAPSDAKAPMKAPSDVSVAVESSGGGYPTPTPEVGLQYVTPTVDAGWM